MSVRAPAVAAILLVSLAAARAWAQETRVLLIPGGAGDPVSAHLIDELIALGVTVEVSSADAQDPARLAAARGVRAVVRVAPSRRAIELWVDSAPGVTAIKEQPGDSGAAALSLRAVELLRGRLLPVERPASPPAPPAPPAPSPNAGVSVGGALPGPPARTPVGLEEILPIPREPASDRPEPATERPWLTLHIAPGVVAHPGSGIAAAGSAVSGIRWMFNDRVGADLMVLAPVMSGVLVSSEGQARLSAVLVGAGAWLHLADLTPTITTGAGLGVAAGFLSYHGQPDTPRVQALEGTVPYGLPYARWAVAWKVLPPLSLRADVLAGVATRRMAIRVAGRDSDEIFGRPLLSFSLGLEVAIR